MIRKLSFLILLIICGLTLAAPLTTPHTFTSGTVAKSSDVNANFQAHADAINDIAKGNPTIVFKMDGIVIGNVIADTVTYQGSNLVQTTKGALMSVTIFPDSNNIQITVSSSPFDLAVRSTVGSYYTSANCTGQAYIIEGTDNDNYTGYGIYAALANQRMMLFANQTDGALYYTQATSPVSLTFNSRYVGTTCYPESYGVLKARMLLPNDPNITGVPQPFIVHDVQNDSYTTMLKNVTLEIQ